MERTGRVEPGAPRPCREARCEPVRGSITGKWVVPEEVWASLWKVWGAGIDTTCAVVKGDVHLLGAGSHITQRGGEVSRH